MFRAVACSIVLTLAVGQNAVLLCRAWCDSRPSLASQCHDDGSSNTPRILGIDSCANAGPSASAAIRADGPRGSFAPDGSHAAVVAGDRFAPETRYTRLSHVPQREWRLEHRPLTVALRI